MSIKDIGYLDFYGEKCVYIQEDMNYVLVPVNEGANIQRHFMEENYLLIFSMIQKQKVSASLRYCSM